MIESVTDITAFNYPESTALLVNADVADWMEQHQAVLPPDEDYPHQSRSGSWVY